jgi:hypothetical protein
MQKHWDHAFSDIGGFRAKEELDIHEDKKVDRRVCMSNRRVIKKVDSEVCMLERRVIKRVEHEVCMLERRTIKKVDRVVCMLERRAINLDKDIMITQT